MYRGGRQKKLIVTAVEYGAACLAVVQLAHTSTHLFHLSERTQFTGRGLSTHNYTYRYAAEITTTLSLGPRPFFAREEKRQSVHACAKNSVK